MSDNESILDLFRRLGALQEGHFLLSSGLHSSGYLQSALVLQHSNEAEALGTSIAEKVKVLSPQVVLSPALGGIIIGHEVGRALGIRTVFAERQNGTLVLRRGFHLSVGEAVVVVEDVITTGGSTRETIELAQAAGANVVGAAAIINRSSSWRRVASNLPAEHLSTVHCRDCSCQTRISSVIKATSLADKIHNAKSQTNCFV